MLFRSKLVNLKNIDCKLFLCYNHTITKKGRCMQYKSSANPLYPVFIQRWRKDETDKFLDWARENLKGQFMISYSNNSSFDYDHYTKPMDKYSYFGELNNYSVAKNRFVSMILFTNPEDLSAFLIVFENVIDT